MQCLSGLAVYQRGATEGVPHTKGCRYPCCSGTDSWHLSFLHRMPSLQLCAALPVGQILELLLEQRLPGQTPAAHLFAGTAALHQLPARACAYESPERSSVYAYTFCGKRKEPGTSQPGCLPFPASQSSSGGLQPGHSSELSAGLCPKEKVFFFTFLYPSFAPALPSPDPAPPPLSPCPVLSLSSGTGTAPNNVRKSVTQSSRPSPSWESCWATSALSAVEKTPPDTQLQLHFIASLCPTNRKE